jgi:hypothetical protein
MSHKAINEYKCRYGLGTVAVHCATARCVQYHDSSPQFTDREYRHNAQAGTFHGYL